MPATNYTPIQLYRSTTSGNVPSAANLSAGEIALNIADNDMTMYMENASGVVKSFFNNPAALKYPTADGTSGQFLTTNGAGVLSFGSVAAGALTNNTRQAVTSSATTTINLNSGNVIDLTMAANITTLSFTNVPASGTPILIQIVVRNASDGTAYTIVWPNSVYWSGQYAANTVSNVLTAPNLATGANGVTVIALLTTDGGTKWRGWVEATIPGGSTRTMYSWGENDQGQLGQNSTINRSSPIQVGSSDLWASVSSYSVSVVAIRNDGTLWTWGANGSGQLGQNNSGIGTYRSTPTQVGTDTNWATASALQAGCAAIKTDGTLWTWGYNLQGQLGQSNAIARSSPVQVGSGSTWRKAFGTIKKAFFIKTDGSLWVTGYNRRGECGLNTSGPDWRSSPVQVGSATNWVQICAARYSTFGVSSDGKLWSWGDNISGVLGQNEVFSNRKSTPTQVGALTTWASVMTGTTAYESCFAIKTDGTLWAWGTNNYEQLGLNGVFSTNPVSSPTQVGLLSDWSSVSFGHAGASSNANCQAIKTNGTLWAWGSGTKGQLGNNLSGATIRRSSPIQIGAGTSWFSSIANGTTTLALIQTSTINPA